MDVVPWDHHLDSTTYDGLFLSNGPGDPQVGNMLAVLWIWIRKNVLIQYFHCTVDRLKGSCSESDPSGCKSYYLEARVVKAHDLSYATLEPTIHPLFPFH